MALLPVVSGLDATRAFEGAGWRRARQKGSHVSLVKPGVNANLMGTLNPSSSPSQISSEIFSSILSEITNAKIVVAHL